MEPITIIIPFIAAWFIHSCCILNINGRLRQLEATVQQRVAWEAVPESVHYAVPIQPQEWQQPPASAPPSKWGPQNGIL
jgi:hypothetical protein